MNSDWIAKAKNEAETWRVVNGIIKPKVSTPITIKTESGNLTEEKEEVAEAFNRYFVEKIGNLKANIEPNSVQDPLIKFSEKWKTKAFIQRLDSNIESKSSNKTYLNIFEIFKKLFKKINIIESRNLIITST